MKDFTKINYLKNGNPKQKSAYNAISQLKLLDKLNQFHPVLTGTIPLAIDTVDSDLDIICYWTDKMQFCSALEVFSIQQEYVLIEKVIRNQNTVICRFNFEGFAFEIFGQNRPVNDQEAYRHMLIEYHILKKNDNQFKQQIIALKKQGVKTEPAFAQLLGLKGDPYAELLRLNL